MIRYPDLDGRRRRRHRRILRLVMARGVIYVRSEHEFRMVERLHRAGLVTACVSKLSWLVDPRLARRLRPFRELAVFALESEARRRYPNALRRSGG